MSGRSMPPMNSDERTTLEAWLDFQRYTLVGKCHGLDELALRTASVPPSPLTLQGLVQHAAEVERNWFRRILAAEFAPPIFGPSADPDASPDAERRAGDHDGGFDLDSGVRFEDAMDIWHREVDAARAHCAVHALDDVRPFMGTEVSLRWIYLHMVGEYARHNGHADLIRERIDGVTGV